MAKKAIKPTDNGESRKDEIKEAKAESKKTMFGVNIEPRFQGGAEKDGTL